MQLDMYMKRKIAMGVLAVLGLSRLPYVGPALAGIMQYNLFGTGITVEYVIAGLAVYAAFLMYNKEI